MLKIAFANMAGRIEIEVEPSGKLAELVETYITGKLTTEQGGPEGYR